MYKLSRSSEIQKMLLSVKITSLFLFITLIQVSASAYSQNKPVSLNLENASIEQFIETVKQECGYRFVYRADLFEGDVTVSVTAENEPIGDVLDKVLSENGFEYEMQDNMVIVREAEAVVVKLEQKDQKSIVIHGTVKDENGQPLPFAAVCFKGTISGCVSAVDGTYELEAPNEPGLVIEISSLGYITQEITVDGQTQINVTLVESIQGLDELVVTGYQTLSKERATGSFSVLNSNNVANSPNETIGGNLESLVAGVQTTVDEDGNVKITVRGESSLTGNAEPLIVVDGFPIEGGFETINRNDVDKITVLKDAAAASIWGARAANGVIVITTKRGSKTKGVQVSFESYAKVSNEVDLDYANPIANSASQLQYEMLMWQQGYGKPSQTIADISNTMTKGSELFQKQLEAHLANGGTGLPTFTLNTPELQHLMTLNYKDQVMEHMLRRPVSQNYNLSIRGQGESNQYSLSVMYNKNEQAIQADMDDNVLINLRNVMKINNWLDLDFGMMTQFKNETSGGVGLNTIKNISPYEQLLDENGDYNHINSSLYGSSYDKRIIDNLHAISDGWSYDDMTYNPLQNMRNQKFNTKYFNTRINTALNARITDGIKYTVSMQYSRGSIDMKNRYLEDSYYTRSTVNAYNVTDYDAIVAGTPQTITDHQLPNGEIAYINNYVTNNYVIRNQFSLDKIYGKHGFNFIAGTEANWSNAESKDDWLYGYNDETYTTVTPDAYVGLTRAYYQDNNTSNIQRGGTLTYSAQKFFSLYSNLAYTYNDKYTVSGSVRTDASNITVEDPKYRYAPFWSVGGSWQLNKEYFLTDIEWIDRMILRGTYGVNGNIPMNTAQVPLISYYSGTSAYSGAGADYAMLNDLGNPTLGWEKVKQLNVAVDYALFNNKLFGSIEYYNKNSYDLVAEVALPSITGTDMQAFNVADLDNKGVEININSNLRLAPGFIWRPTLNFAYNKSYVSNVKTSSLPLDDLYYNAPYVEGYAYQPIWSYELSGETNEFGIPLIAGENGVDYPANVNISSSGEYGPDLVNFIGSKVAPVVSSLTNEFSYKGFSLVATITGKFGHYMYNSSFNYTTRQDAMTFHKDLEYLVDGRSEEIGMFALPEEMISGQANYYSNASYLDSRVEDASFIRFKDVMLSYTLNKKVASRLKTSNIRLYTQISNVGMIWTANDKGIDPEYPMGLSYFKPETTYTVGLNINF